MDDLDTIEDLPPVASAAPVEILIDYIGSAVEVGPRGATARPDARHIAPLVLSGCDVILSAGVTSVDADTWAVIKSDHPVIVKMIGAGDISVMASLPRRQPDVLALVARTYNAAVLDLLGDRESTRATPRAAVVAAIATQRRRMAKPRI